MKFFITSLVNTAEWHKGNTRVDMIGSLSTGNYAKV